MINTCIHNSFNKLSGKIYKHEKAIRRGKIFSTVIEPVPFCISELKSPCYSDNKRTCSFALKMYTLLFISFGFCFLHFCAAVVPYTNSTQKSNDEYINEYEVPDSFLLGEKLKFKKESETRAEGTLARQNQDQNSTNSRRCTCLSGVCKCCTGFIMDLFKQKACMKVTYHPGDFAFDVAMSMNNRILYENSVSGKNPKPICINPPRLTNLRVCAKFYNVFFPGRNFHFCLAMVGNWGSFELFNLVFDCLRMGANGIAMVKPYDNGGISVPNPHGGVDAVIDAGEDDIEDYDENVVRSVFGDLFYR